MQSRETQITVVKWTNAGGQTKRANERSFVYRPPAWRRWRKVKTTYTAEFARNGILTDCIEIQRESSPCWCRSIPLDFEQGNYAKHEWTAKKCTQITVHSAQTPCCCCFTIETLWINNEDQYKYEIQQEFFSPILKKSTTRKASLKFSWW